MTLEEIRAALQEQLTWMEELRDKLQDLSILADEDALTRALNDLLSDVRTGPLSDVGADDAEQDSAGTLVLYDAHGTPYASIDTPQLARELIALIEDETTVPEPDQLGSGVVHPHREQEYPRSTAQSQEAPTEDPQGM